MCVAYEKKCIFQLFVIFTLLLAFCSQKWWSPLYPSSSSQLLKSVFCSQRPSLASDREEIHLHFPKWLASCSSAIFQGAIFCPPLFFSFSFQPLRAVWLYKVTRVEPTEVPRCSVSLCQRQTRKACHPDPTEASVIL